MLRMWVVDGFRVLGQGMDVVAFSTIGSALDAAARDVRIVNSTSAFFRHNCDKCIHAEATLRPYSTPDTQERCSGTGDMHVLTAQMYHRGHAHSVNLTLLSHFLIYLVNVGLHLAHLHSFCTIGSALQTTLSVISVNPIIRAFRPFQSSAQS